MSAVADRPRTLPELARATGIGVDQLRIFVRSRPDLADLAERVGCVRAFSPANAAAIAAEYRAAKSPTR